MNVLINGVSPGELMRDTGGDRVLVKVGRDAVWIDRSRVTFPADHLGRNEPPGPANAAYRGVMAERLNKRGGQ